MNAYGTDEMESVTELLEGLEYDESDELAERRGRRGRGRQPPPPTAPGRGSYQPRPPTQDVTQTQLMATIARIEGQIKTNSEAITKVNARVNTVADQQASQAVAIKKENTERKKDIKDIRQTTQMLALLPLLARPSTREITATTPPAGLQTGDKVLIDSDGFNSLLPLLLVGGLGGGGGGGLGLGGEGDSSSSLLMVLALSGGLGGKR